MSSHFMKKSDKFSCSRVIEPLALEAGLVVRKRVRAVLRPALRPVSAARGELSPPSRKPSL